MTIARHRGAARRERVLPLAYHTQTAEGAAMALSRTAFAPSGSLKLEAAWPWPVPNRRRSPFAVHGSEPSRAARGACRHRGVMDGARSRLCQCQCPCYCALGGVRCVRMRLGSQ